MIGEVVIACDSSSYDDCNCIYILVANFENRHWCLILQYYCYDAREAI